jgi:hypothetical protein
MAILVMPPSDHLDRRQHVDVIAVVVSPQAQTVPSLRTATADPAL